LRTVFSAEEACPSCWLVIAYSVEKSPRFHTSANVTSTSRASMAASSCEKGGREGGRVGGEALCTQTQESRRTAFSAHVPSSIISVMHAETTPLPAPVYATRASRSPSISNHGRYMVVVAAARVTGTATYLSAPATTGWSRPHWYST
jgi:hypothetical protein